MKRLLLNTTILLTMLSMVSLEATAHDFEVDGIYYNITSSTENTVEVTYKGNNYSSSVYSGSVVIPESVTNDGETYKVTSIGNYAFYSCDGLTSIEIPNSVTSIGEHAFQYCSGLTSVVIPNSVTTIVRFAFIGCSGLTSVEIPNSVTSIGVSPFGWCSKLKSIQVDEGNPVYDSRENCNAIIQTAEDKLIQGCLNTIIPNSITTIGRLALNGSRDYINLPKTIESIEAQAFGSYDIIESAIENPFDINENVFSDYCYRQGMLIVPVGTKELYEQREGWKNFSQIIEGDARSICKTYLRVMDESCDVVAYFPLEEEPTVKFGTDELTIASSTQELTFPLDKVQFEYCTEIDVPTDINLPEKLQQDRLAEEAVLTGLNEGELIRVYAQDGKLVMTCQAGADGIKSINLRSLPRGLYIVHAGTMSFKFINSNK